VSDHTLSDYTLSDYTAATAGNWVYNSDRKEPPMPKYVIERNLPRAGQLSPAELAAVSDKSCSALRSFGSRVQWMQSYVTGDKIYCIYVAPSEGVIREHARLAGFPVHRIAEVTAIIDPATSEAALPESERIHDYAKEAGVY